MSRSNLEKGPMMLGTPVLKDRDREHVFHWGNEVCDMLPLHQCRVDVCAGRGNGVWTDGIYN